jgi:hypothetical protein
VTPAAAEGETPETRVGQTGLPPSGERPTRRRAADRRRFQGITRSRGGAARATSSGMNSTTRFPPSDSPITVLVIEPVPLLAARLLRIALLCETMDVSLAEGFAPGSARLRDYPYDVVIVDVDTMSWPGLRELEELRAAAPGALLVAVTSEADPETSLACRARGADRILDLRAVLAELVRLSGP